MQGDNNNFSNKENQLNDFQIKVVKCKFLVICNKLLYKI